MIRRLASELMEATLVEADGPQPVFAQCAHFAFGAAPVSDCLADQGGCLPSGPNKTGPQADRIAESGIGICVPPEPHFLNSMKRSFDVLLTIFAALILSGPILLVALLVRITSPGPVLYWSERIGVRNRVFRMPKFRTMRVDTPVVATHLLQNPDSWLTPIGGFLRKSSLDELPQLWSVLVGDMSLVGPRPALFNQEDLIAQRTERGVHLLTPGLTGLAQVSGRDELSIPQKVELDAEYLRRRSLALDALILWKTVLKVVRRDGVSH